MVSHKYWSNKRMKQMFPVWNRILKRSDAKNNSVDNVSANSGYSTYTSQPGPSNKDESTISSQLSVTSDANASFTQPIVKYSVHSSTTLTNQDSIIGSNPEYKEDLHNQPVITELAQYEWELVIRKRMERHIANNIKGIITNIQF